LPKKEEIANEEYYLAYLALLHAPLIDSLLEMVSVNVAGGQYDLSKRYAENMPLPDLTNADPTLFNYLITIGSVIHNGLPFDKKELNDAVSNTYGISLESVK